MNMIQMADIENLMAPHEAPCVSIYMPTHRAGRKEVEQDPIRFKNLLGQAEKELVDRGMRTREVREILSPAMPLLEAWDFWNHQSDGLAVFISRDEFGHYRVPFRFPEMATVSDYFHIKPLVPLVTNDGTYFLLAMSQDRVRVLQGTRDSVAELDLDTLPKGLADALRHDNPQKELQFHTGAPKQPFGGRRDALFFGTGAADPGLKKGILRYFQKVDAGLHELLREERAPLVLAGVEYLFPIFREASKYPNIVEGIPGNPDEIPAAELHTRAWELVRPQFESAQQEALLRFSNLRGMGSEQAVDRLEQVIPAAYAGRVEALFVPAGKQEFGSFDPERMELTVHESRANGDRDLYDLAAVYTLVKDGRVYTVDPADMPGRGPVAATLRY